MKWLVNLCRFILAGVFIFSGFVKAVDPLGTQYKLQDYAEAVGLAGMLSDWLTLGGAVALATFEFALGIYMLFAIQRRRASKVVLAFVAVMALVTLWIAVWNPVEDCGCFGDAVKLTNWQTFGKNVVLLGAALVVARHPLLMPRFVSKTNQWIVKGYTIIFTLVVSAISLYLLPLFDFRPYHIGADLRKGMEIPEGVEQPKFETTFVMKKNGETREFTLENYPDSTWEFVDRKTRQTKAGYVPLIHDFSIEQRPDGDDITEQVLDDQGYTFLLIAPHIEQADESNFGDIEKIYEYALEQNIPFYCLTASGEEATRKWSERTGAEYPFCTTDPTTLKTIIRSNPGLVLIKDGRVVNKWSHNALPDDELPQGRLETSPLGQVPSDPAAKKVMKILLWFVLPLFLLTLADRLWAWTRWFRWKKKRTSYQFNKQKTNKMRKKIVAGNWKMNMNLQEGIALAKELNETLTAEKPNCDVVICTPFIHLASIAQFLNQDVIGLGAENCADKEKGAYTGEVSAEMVKSTGAGYVILGHSERREYYKETPEVLREKVLLALKNDLKVIFCIGESLEEREAGKQNEVCKAELEGSVFNLSEEEFKNIVIAYEPIWAIGTGKTATAEQAEEIHAYIRSIIAEKYGQAVADNTSILYGGSCKASNAPELFAKPDIDGGLIGGASLKAADFKGIIDAWK